MNDVKDLSAALIEFYGFKKSDIAVLLDGAATQKAMQAGITSLLRGAKKGDVLVLSLFRPRIECPRRREKQG